MAGHRGWLVGSPGWEFLHGKDASPGGASSFALLLQHPRVPVLRQHPQQEEQHEDATCCRCHVHSVSGEGGFSALGGAGQGILAFCSWMSKVVCAHRYLDNQVFVSLANGELVVYQREAGEVGFGMSKTQPQSGGFWRMAWATSGEGCSGWLPSFHGKGYPWRDAGDTTRRGRWKWAFFSWFLQATGTPWWHQFNVPSER